MQAQQIITDARRELLETVGIFWSDAELLRLYNKAEMDFVNKTRMLEDTAQLTLIAGQSDYPLPQNWLSAKAIFIKVINDDSTFKWKRLWPSNLEKISQEDPNFLDTDTDSSQGLPSKYWIWGRSFRLNRAPSAQYATTVMMFFKSKPIPVTVLTQSINIDESVSDALTSYILWKAWKKEKEQDLADGAYAEYVGWIAEGRKWVKKQSGDQRFKFDIESGTGFTNPVFGANPFPFTA